MAAGVVGGLGDPVLDLAEAELKHEHARVTTHLLPMVVVTAPGLHLIQHPATHTTAQVSG